MTIEVSKDDGDTWEFYKRCEDSNEVEAEMVSLAKAMRSLGITHVQVITTDS